VKVIILGPVLAGLEPGWCSGSNSPLAGEDGLCTEIAEFCVDAERFLVPNTVVPPGALGHPSSFEEESVLDLLFSPPRLEEERAARTAGPCLPGRPDEGRRAAVCRREGVATDEVMAADIVVWVAVRYGMWILGGAEFDFETFFLSQKRFPF
jgi:hypothetical protein